MSHEACALAGAWRLNKLVALYDDNGISIDGAVAPWFVDDTARRFGGLRLERDPRRRRPRRRRGRRRARRGQGRRPADADRLPHDHRQGAPNRAGTAKAHGEALGADEVRLTREALAWSTSRSSSPRRCTSCMGRAPARRGRDALGRPLAAGLRPGASQLAAELARPHGRPTALGLGHQAAVDAAAVAAQPRPRPLRHRKGEPDRAGGVHEDAARCWAARRPDRIEPSHTSTTPEGPSFDVRTGARRRAANYVNYGVREFGMAAIMNGIALHGGFIPYGGTFLTFSATTAATRSAWRR